MFLLTLKCVVVFVPAVLVFACYSCGLCLRCQDSPRERAWSNLAVITIELKPTPMTGFYFLYFLKDGKRLFAIPLQPAEGATSEIYTFFLLRESQKKDINQIQYLFTSHTKLKRIYYKIDNYGNMEYMISYISDLWVTHYRTVITRFLLFSLCCVIIK